MTGRAAGHGVFADHIRTLRHGCVGWLVLTGNALASPSDIGGPKVSSDWKWKSTFEYKDDLDRTWIAPKLAFSRPFSSDFEGEIALSHMRLDGHEGGDAAGVGDLELKGKWALLQGNGALRPGVALEPKLVLPAGSRHGGLGVDDAQFELPVLVGWQSGSVGLFTKAGYRQGFNGNREDRRYMGGILLTYQPVSAFRLGIDLYTEAPRHDTDAYRSSTNLGLNWYLSRAIEIQALVGRTIRHPADREAYKAKFVIEYKVDGRGR